MRQKLVLCILFTLVAAVGSEIFGQYTLQVEGYIKDSVTNEALPDVTVALVGTTIGTASANDGYYFLRTSSDSLLLRISYVGYETQLITLHKGINRINVSLNPSGMQLNEVVIRPGRERYSRRDNPAVDFVERVMERRALYNPKNQDYFSHSIYEQRTFAFDDFNVEKARQNWALKQVDFIFDYVDSTSVSGRTILPLYNEEISADYFYRRSPRAEQKIINAYKRAGIIEIVS